MDDTIYTSTRTDNHEVIYAGCEAFDLYNRLLHDKSEAAMLETTHRLKSAAARAAGV